MKNLILVIALLLGVMGLTSCTSQPVNDAKIKTVDAAQKFVERTLTKAYDGIVIDGYSCETEVVEIGNNVHNELNKFLKVKAVTSQMVGSSLLIPICEVVGKKYLPEIINGSANGSYRCLKYLGADGVKKLSDKLCGLIKL